MGYLIGCLFSILLWRIDRQIIYYKMDLLIKKFFKNKYILFLFHILMLLFICFIIKFIPKEELLNFITSFLVIDISNNERKNLKKREKVHFYDSISTISQCVVCGFIAPLLYILISGNTLALIYTYIYNLNLNNESNKLKFVFNTLTIIPSIIAEVFLYLIYIIRNKKFTINFRGDFLVNLYKNPLLNVDILAAYIESVNFYYYFNADNTSYLKSYGQYSKKIDAHSIKDYLSITYSICMITFLLFFSIIRIK